MQSSRSPARGTAGMTLAGGAAATLPAPLGQRARHGVTEDKRGLAAVRSLRAGDATELGCLFVKSHSSMQDDFQVSIPNRHAGEDCVSRAGHFWGAPHLRRLRRSIVGLATFGNTTDAGSSGIGNVR